MTSRPILCAAAAALAFACPVSAQQGMQTFFDSIFTYELAQGHFRNAAIVVVRDTQVIYQNGYGRMENGQRPDPARTVYRIASVSKLFAATAAMQLAEQHRLDLGADINTYLKGFRIDSHRGPVTMATLLTHTSGLENRMIGGLARDSSSLKSLERYFASHPPHVDATPGSQFAYSNNGMALAGHIVEAVSGESFDEYAQRHILTPLGMKSSSFFQPIPRELLTRMPDPSRNRGAPLFIPAPAAALVATPLDMTRFMIAHLNNGVAGGVRILDSATVSLMHETHWSPGGDAQGAAYGFFESQMNGQRALFHTGDSGHHGILFLLPDHRVGFYAVYDASDGTLQMMERLTKGFMDRFYPALTPAVSPAASPGGDLRKYEGTYMLNGANPHTVEKLRGLMQIVVRRAHGDTLSFTAPDGSRLTGVMTGPDQFRLSDGGILTFHRANGDSDGFHLTGSIWDPQSAHRVHPLLDIRLHKAAAIVVALALLSRILTGVVTLWRAMRGNESARALRQTLAWRASGAMVALVVLAPVVALATVATAPKPIVAIPFGISVALLLLLLASVAAIALPFLVARAWRDGTTRMWQRIYLSGLATALLLLPFVLGSWNLLGWRY